MHRVVFPPIDVASKIGISTGVGMLPSAIVMTMTYPEAFHSGSAHDAGHAPRCAQTCAR